MSIILIGLCMLGIFFCIAALCIQYTYSKKLKLCTTCVKAEIIDMAVETSRVMDSYYRQSYYPIFRYTYNNVEYTAQSNLGYTSSSNLYYYDAVFLIILYITYLIKKEGM